MVPLGPSSTSVASNLLEHKKLFAGPVVSCWEFLKSPLSTPLNSGGLSFTSKTFTEIARLQPEPDSPVTRRTKTRQSSLARLMDSLSSGSAVETIPFEVTLKLAWGEVTVYVTGEVPFIRRCNSSSLMSLALPITVPGCEFSSTMKQH